jgi:hypothetical protein
MVNVEVGQALRELEMSVADVMATTAYQQYALILDEDSAFYWAVDDLHADLIAEVDAWLTRQDELDSMPYSAYLLSPEWKNLADAAKHRDGYRCRLCNASDRPLNAHHRTYRAARRMTVVDDLTTLCDRCHNRHHGVGPSA